MAPYGLVGTTDTAEHLLQIVDRALEANVDAQAKESLRARVANDHCDVTAYITACIDPP